MSQPTWGEFERLRPGQIDAIKASAPIAYVPWGALEWHSYHNPIGLDGLKAHALCSALAAKTGGVVLPTVFVGTDTIKPFKGFKHTIDHPFDTVKDLCLQFLEQLADEDFRVLIVLTGHYGGEHVKALAAAGDAFQKANAAVSVWILADWQPLEGLFDPNHAALGETSFMLSIDSETVDISLLPDDRVTTLDEDGVMGEDPRRATSITGDQQIAALVENAAPRILDMLKTQVTRE